MTMRRARSFLNLHIKGKLLCLRGHVKKGENALKFQIFKVKFREIQNHEQTEGEKLPTLKNEVNLDLEFTI